MSQYFLGFLLKGLLEPEFFVMPAKAGIQKNLYKTMDSRLRGNDIGCAGMT
jgi:hypothetical protein